MADLVSKKTRQEFREYFVGTSLRHITQEFDAADVLVDTEYEPPVSGERRALVEQYYHTVDWQSWRDVRKVLNVYEHVLLALETLIPQLTHDGAKVQAEQTFAVLTRYLKRDGFAYADGRITAVGDNPSIDELSDTATEMDAQVLRQQVERIRHAIDDDPDLAIGTAKELLETTCKTILADAGTAIDPTWDLQRLAKEARSVLQLVPEDVPNSTKGAEVVKRILSSLAQVSTGIAELRNLYGTGHGKGGRSKSLSARHARLAASCATTLAIFLFETHEARKEKTT
jgi:hypothetical protein